MILTKRHKALLAIFGPVIVLAAWIGSFAFVVNSGETVRLRITGYDPRDMLAGHYLRYTVNYGSPVDCRRGDNISWCLCLDRLDGKYAQISQQASCGQISGCQNLLQGSCSNGGFAAGIERFYFAEEHQKLLRFVPPDSAITVALSSTGKGVVKGLLVKEELLIDWLQRQDKPLP